MPFAKGDRVLSNGEMGMFEGEVVDVDMPSMHFLVLEDGTDNLVWCHRDELTFLGTHPEWLQAVTRSVPLSAQG